MKKIVLFIALAASLGGSVSWAQDTVWMKPAPLSPQKDIVLQLAT